LLECVVFGRRTGAAIAHYVADKSLPNVDEHYYLHEARQQIQALLDQPQTCRIHSVRQAFQDLMTDYCGVFRTEALIQTGLSKLKTLQAQATQIGLDDKGTCWNTEIIEALELRNLMVVGELILTSALQRQESRGAHCREDYPHRDDTQFLKHTMATYTQDRIEVYYRPVVITMFPPQERKY
jgi:succinate dehydrogenase / fumarate reductase, flavoprotein subunit